MNRIARGALVSLTAVVIVIILKVTFFAERVGVAVSTPEKTGSHAWAVDKVTDFTASLEPWPVKPGEETHLIVWYAQDPSSFRIVPPGATPEPWSLLKKEKVAGDLEEGEPGFLHKAKWKLPAGVLSIELRVRDSSGNTHELTGWKVSTAP